MQDEDDSSWSHMSDYDEFGLLPDADQAGIKCQNDHQESGNEPSEVESDAPHCEGSNKVRDHASGTQKEEDHVDYVHEIQTLKDDAHESNHNGGSLTEGNSTNGSNNIEVQFNNHDADTRSDYAGGSHVVCSNHSGVLNQDGACDNADKVWRPTDQSYWINGWRSTNEEEKEQDLVGCMMKGTRFKKKITRLEEDESDEESTELVCNMTGQSWESLAFPIIIDSGACASVMPTDWCNHVPLYDTPQSQAGDYYRAANGNKIYHEGDRIVFMMTQEGSLRDMKFIVCNVSKALGFVSQMCRTGRRVVFNPRWAASGSYIEHVDIGERMWLQEEGGLYVLKTKVAPASRQIRRRKAEDFHWPVISP